MKEEKHGGQAVFEAEIRDGPLRGSLNTREEEETERKRAVVQEIKTRDDSRYEKDTQKIHLFDLDLMLTLTS